MTMPLHIIEPRLTGDAGHCHSLVRALAGAARGCDVTVWGGRDAAALWQGPGELKPRFRPHWRRWQALWLMRRLLRESGRILVSTAGSADLVTAAWAARGRIPPRKLFLFVHWLGNKAAKARRFAALARRQPNIEIIAPTAGVADFFASCGFRSTVVRYPVEVQVPRAADDAAPAFARLLVAGGARLDKGFAQVVELVLEMQRRGRALPILVQTSVEPGQQHDAALLHEIERLRGIPLTGLTLRDEPIDATAWRAMFDGAIVVQPYRAAEFADRVSGVTLDALAAGAPLVVTEGTWMAALVRRHGAGVVTADVSGPGLLAAVERVLADYAHFAQQARAAAARIGEEHGAQHLMNVVLQGGHG